MPSPSPAPLTLTGERTLPGIEGENYWFRRHEAAYLALAPFATGAVVLETGCGEGYGADLLSRVAHQVVALDYDESTALHAATAYPHLTVARADLQRLPVADGSVEVVANLQVIEHLHDQAGFVAECARVLRPAGTLLLTTPNRLTFSPDWVPGTPHLNPFHTRELSAAELVALTHRGFALSRLWGLRHGPALARWERRHGSIVDAQLGTPEQHWPTELRRTVASLGAGDFVVDDRDVDASLDLVLVAVKRA